MKPLGLVCVVAGVLVGSVAARAQQEVRIGAIYPLSGPVAQIGIDAVAAMRTVEEIVNDGADLPLPLAKGKGLPGLGGARIKLFVADHHGKPEDGLAETERMITQEKVHAFCGATQSSVTAAASQAAERAGIPFMNGDSSSPALTERGFKYFFRTTPTDRDFSTLMFDFIRDLEAKKGIKIQSASLFHEDTAFGSDSGKAQLALAKERGVTIKEDITYKSQTTSLTSEVQRLKAASADILLPTSYTSDAFLLLRTAKELDYNPKLLVAQNGGFTDPSFLPTMGKDAEGVITRSPYNGDLGKTIPLIGRVNEIFKKHSKGRDLSDISARVFTAMMTLADAINRAGSTDPEKIREALTKTDIPPEQLIMPYKGVRFDEKGQNTGVRPILMQARSGSYCTIYPFELATCEMQYPMPTWEQKSKP